jgi:Ca-activated chloride channel homolog
MNRPRGKRPERAGAVSSTMRSVWMLLVAVLLAVAGVPEVWAQGGVPQPDGWQGPRPAPQQSTPTPVPQRLPPAGKQVLEIPPRPQQRVPEGAQQQGAIPPRPQTETARPTHLITVTVVDPQGTYVSGLRREDFLLYEDSVPQDITYFNTGQDEPVSLGLVVDTTGSMHSKIDHARQALRRFVDAIHPQDEVFIEAFNTQPMLLQDFTDSRLLLGYAISRLQPAGQTALYDAILDGLRRVRQGRYQKKALIVLTDGLDNASLASLRQTTEAAHRAGVLIYTIGIGNPHAHFSPGVAGLSFGPFSVVGGGDDDRIDARTLQELSEETGAKLFVLDTADVISNTDVLDTAVQTISRELRQQYSLGYTSSGGGNRYRSVRVETRHGDLVVRAQKGYATE